MDDQKRQKITGLAKNEHAKKCRVDNLAAMNIYGKSFEELQQMRIDYALAVAEHNEAIAALEAAQRVGE